MNGTNNTNGDTVRPFRIAIVGGAIGGLTAALFLDHFCRTQRRPDPQPIAIDVYEQASEYREIGAAVGVGLNAARLVHMIPGLGAGINSIRGRRYGAWFTYVRGDNGETIADMKTPPEKDTCVRESSMARSEFLDLMLDIIRERAVARLHTKKKFVSVKDLGTSGVEITFQDNTTAEADLLVGSDGIHSEVRKAFVQSKALYSGKIAYRGIIPIDKLPRENWPGVSSTPGQTNWSVAWLTRHKHVVVVPMSQNRSLSVVAYVAKREDEIPDLQESWTSTCERRELERDFSDCDATLQEVIRLMPERPSKWRISDLEPVPQWTFLGGKVVLLGDACHATTPHQGAGAGQAIEDGYILSRALADWLSGGRKTPLKDWMGLYQQIRLPRAQKVVETSRQAGALYEFESPDLIDLSYEEAAPMIAERLKTRMKWIWTEDLDAVYDKERQEAGL